MSDHTLDAVDRAVINAFQGGFPVVERPFEPAAAALRERGVDVTPSGLVERVRRLDEADVLTRFGALVNAEAIGGTATLVAMHAPEDRFEEVAAAVNDRRAVAHNYEREHDHLNVWFVVSVPDPDRVDEVLAAIEADTGQQTYNLPKEREFRVEAKFPVDGPLREGNVDLSHLDPDASPTDTTAPSDPSDASDPSDSTDTTQTDGTDPSDPSDPTDPTDGTGLSAAERDLVVEIQDGLPVTETPYRDVASALGRDLEWVLETIARFDGEGKVRRVGVVPNHYALGYTENGMTVWDVPDDVVETVGPAVASLPFVTHCYRRPRHEGVWPYNFFAMTHGRSDAESDRRIDRVREVMADHWDVTGDDWETLFSTRILKKTGIRLAERASANVDAE